MSQSDPFAEDTRARSLHCAALKTSVPGMQPLKTLPSTTHELNASCTLAPDAYECEPASAPLYAPLPGASKRTRSELAHSEHAQTQTWIDHTTMPEFSMEAWEDMQSPMGPLPEMPPQTFERTSVIKCKEGTFLAIPRVTVLNQSIYACILDALSRVEQNQQDDLDGRQAHALCQLEGMWRTAYADAAEDTHPHVEDTDL